MGIKSTKSIVVTLLAGLILTLAPSASPAMAAPASPAVAAPGASIPSGEVVCFFQTRHGFIVGIRCIAFRPLMPDCIKCDVIVVDYGDVFVHDRLVDGFIQLDNAARATDPRVAAGYRKAALDRFMTVAVATSGDIMRDTGFVDRKTGRFVSEPRQWLTEAGAELDLGLGLLREVGLDPDGDPAVGMGHIGNSYQQLAHGR
jgi:hypothetical protein